MTDWGAEPATDKQKKYLTKLGKEYSPSITKIDASKLISETIAEKQPFKTEEQKRFEAEYWKKEEEKRRLQDEAYERESWYEDHRSLINDYSSLLKQKKMNKKLFRGAVEALEAAGMTREQIDDAPEAVFDEACDIDRSRTRRDGWRPTNHHVRRAQPKRSQPKRGSRKWGKSEIFTVENQAFRTTVIIVAILFLVAYWVLF